MKKLIKRIIPSRPEPLEKVSVAGRSLAIQKRKGWFNSREIFLTEGKKKHTAWNYWAEGKSGFISTSGPNLKVRLPHELRGYKLSSKMADHMINDLKNNMNVNRIEVNLYPDLDSENAIHALFANRGFKKVGEVGIPQQYSPLDGLIPADVGHMAVGREDSVIERWVWKK